jgi:hypothetical protein
MPVRPRSLISSVRRLPAVARFTVAAATVSLAIGMVLSGSGPTLAARAGNLAGRAPAGGLAGYDASTGQAVPAAGQAPASSQVALITGDTVRLGTADGQQRPIVAPAAGKRLTSPDFIQFSFAGDQYVVPDEAVPYLGTVLDPRLFDVSYLARAHLGVVPRGAAYGAAIPVTLSYPGSAPPRLPGLRITQAGAGTADGTFDPGQGAQLARLLGRDDRTGSAGRPAIGRLSLAPPAGAPPLPASPIGMGQASVPDLSGAASRSGLPFRRLTVNLIGPDGNPASLAFGIVQNVDNAALDSVVAEPQDNTISFSLPAGTYSVTFVILTPHAGTAFGYDAAMVVQPQLSLTADKTVSLDARDAVPYEAGLTGATAPATQLDILDLARGSVTGGVIDSSSEQYLGMLSVSGDGFAATSMSATPTAPVTEGTLSVTGIAELSTGLEASSADPTYTFSFPTEGRIPASLTYTVPAADLTAVHSDLYTLGADACGGAYVNELLSHPSLPSNPLEVQYQVPPGSRTDYIYDSAPSLDSWQLSALTSSGGVCQLWQPTGPEPVRPGGQVSVAWDKGPLVPSPVAPSLAALRLQGSGTVCPACRQGDLADLTIASDGDSQQHVESLPFAFGTLSPASGLSFYRNGSLAVTSDASCSVVLAGSGQGTCAMAPTGLVLPLLPGAATYRLDWQLAGTGPATVDTSWTFRSGPADRVFSRLPGPEQCAPDPTAGCSLLPLLFLRYDLPLTMDSQAVAGQPLTAQFTAGYQQNAPAAPDVTATVAASFDGGKTWSAPAGATALGGGRFSVTISQPQLSATNGFASLRVVARDGAGNSVTQTIIDAYGLTS